MTRHPLHALTVALATTALTTALVGTTASAQPAHHGARAYAPELYADKPAEGSFERMFPLEDYGLAPHPSPIYDLRRLGEFGTDDAPGPMRDDDSRPDSRIEAGITFLGQFVDHDITLDVTTGLDRRAIPEEVRNFRTPDLDLDCVYGDGREATPWLYDGPFLVVGAEIDGTTRNDLARVPGTMTALIGDPRNDENFILAQIQAAFIAFHNRLAENLLAQRMEERGLDDGGDPRAALEDLKTSDRALHDELVGETFESARDHTIHYYHRMLVEYFLPKVIGLGRTLDIATLGRRYYLQPLTEAESEGGKVLLKNPPMPVEFSAAAYRFGHSQVRESYQRRVGEEPEPLFRMNDQNGFVPVDAKLAIDFALFYPIRSRSDVAPQTTRPLDPRLPTGLFKLDEVEVVPAGDLGSLAARNLNRGRTFRLPSGEDLFRIITLPMLEEGEITQPSEGLLALGVSEEVTAKLSTLPQTAASRYTFEQLPEKIAPAQPATAAATAEPEVDIDDLPDIFGRAPEEVRNVLALPSSPLWFYILNEASRWPVVFLETPGTQHAWPVEKFIQKSVDYLHTVILLSLEKGTMEQSSPEYHSAQVLGPVGGTIVGEVIIGLIDHYREKTGKGLDFITELKGDHAVEMTEFGGFGPRMTFGDMIEYIGWDGELAEQN